MSKSRVTLEDVARRAGVSRSTASLVVRKSELIAKKTREKVELAMTELGYVYNQSAANLRTRTTRTLGMVIADITNPFYADLARGIEFACDDKNFLTIFANTDESATRQSKMIRRMIEQNVAGVFLCPAGPEATDDIDALHATGIPAVLIMRYIKSPYVGYVGPDNFNGAQVAISHMAKLGRRRIAILGGPADRSSSRERLRGYRSGLRKHELPIHDELIKAIPINRRAAMEAGLELLRLPEPPDAIVCYNDIIAFGAMLAANKLGLVPGRDVAIIGFDDIPEAALWSPSLTTVAIDAHEIGRTAAQELLATIRDPRRQIVRRRLSTKLVVRESCGENYLD